MQNEGFFLSNVFQEIDASGIGGAHVVPMDTIVRDNINYTLQIDGTIKINNRGVYYISYVSEARSVSAINEITSFWELQRNGVNIVGGNGQLVHITPQPMANHTKNVVLTLDRGDIISICATKSIQPPSHLWSDIGSLTMFIAEL